MALMLHPGKLDSPRNGCPGKSQLFGGVGDEAKVVGLYCKTASFTAFLTWPLDEKASVKGAGARLLF